MLVDIGKIGFQLSLRLKTKTIILREQNGTITVLSLADTWSAGIDRQSDGSIIVRG